MFAALFNVKFTDVYFIFWLNSFLSLFLHDVLILYNVLILIIWWVFRILPTCFWAFPTWLWNAFDFYSHIDLVFVERVFYVGKIGLTILEQVYCICPMRFCRFFRALFDIYQWYLPILTPWAGTKDHLYCTPYAWFTNNTHTLGWNYIEHLDCTPYACFTSCTPYACFTSSTPYACFTSSTPYACFTSSTPYACFTSSTPYTFFTSSAPYAYFTSSIPYITCFTYSTREKFKILHLFEQFHKWLWLHLLYLWLHLLYLWLHLLYLCLNLL